MFVETAAKNTLTQLAALIGQLNDAQYVLPCNELNDATIGQHCRHVIEMFECLLEGYPAGHINYDARLRNKDTEQMRVFAINKIDYITGALNLPSKSLLLSAGYHAENDSADSFATTYHRELAYSLEHAVHHMAIIKIGLRFVAPTIELPREFGVAASTVRYLDIMSK